MIGKQFGVLCQGAATSIEIVQGHTGSLSGELLWDVTQLMVGHVHCLFTFNLVAEFLLVLQPLFASSNLPAVVHPLCIS